MSCYEQWNFYTSNLDLDHFDPDPNSLKRYGSLLHIVKFPLSVNSVELIGVGSDTWERLPGKWYGSQQNRAATLPRIISLLPGGGRGRHYNLPASNPEHIWPNLDIRLISAFHMEKRRRPGAVHMQDPGHEPARLQAGQALIIQLLTQQVLSHFTLIISNVLLSSHLNSHWGKTGIYLRRYRKTYLLQ